MVTCEGSSFWWSARSETAYESARFVMRGNMTGLLCAIKVGDRHDVLRAARELDELGQDAAPGDVERQVDAVGREGGDPLHEALAVGDGLSAQ